MPRIVFAPAIQRHVAVAAQDIAAGTVREALDAAFAVEPRLRGYILDDQRRLRAHLAIFVDGVAVRDRAGLTDMVPAGSEVYVVQALSGG
ncbi:thiamine biosynthesis protein ThiS [Pigmentiphaga sp. NML080357]|uniref:MoaD/ThiS family protein n=1 Tax=Pigmentiphaga sp. NML080357 TaxID=2008675 RepID=UPI000B410842|nr:MoaD/ThiS family protein [Pigmentiphaga sp. NML080357]OVZ55585.1 thiamine biosynthesis protein ThiS [Pigmentiphaga sp. NML080357]